MAFHSMDQSPSACILMLQKLQESREDDRGMRAGVAGGLSLPKLGKPSSFHQVCLLPAPACLLHRNHMTCLLSTAGPSRSQYAQQFSYLCPFTWR